MKKTELLAPAGSTEAIISAVQSGADAVYLGLLKFSARDGAKNLDIADLKKWVDYCHLRNVSVFLAANTLIKDMESEEFIDYVGKAAESGIDAVIVQDMGMARLIKKHIPALPLHASTQMTVSSKEGVKYLEKQGFKRVVLSRELTKDELIEIRKSTDIELEMFVHGALCFSYSGQCLMSSIIGRRSGNRGMCAQPCRLSYDVLRDGKTLKTGYILSPKDLALIDKIPEISEIGIDSLKIEGRLKGGEYVATCVSVYKKALSGEEITKEDKDALLSVFNRSGFTEGWYSGAKNFMSGMSPGNIASGKTTSEFLKFTKEDANFKKIYVDIYSELKRGEVLNLTLIDEDGFSVSVSGEKIGEDAINKPLDKERLLSQLSKLGDSVFSVRNSEIIIDDGIVLPVSEINEVRRKAVALLEKERLYRDEVKISAYKREKTEKNIKKPYISAVCHTIEQAKAASDLGVFKIVAPKNILDKLKTDSKKVMLLNPVGENENPGEYPVMAMNIGHLERYKDSEIHLGFRLNITNSESEKAFGISSYTVSPELNLKDISDMDLRGNAEVIAYGRLPLMLLRACPMRMNNICHGEGGYYLKDRQGEIFPVKCHKGCVSEILNSKPIFMADKLSEIDATGISGLELWFYDEDFNKTCDIIKKYQGEGNPEPLGEFTRGHFYRGFILK